MGYGKKKQKKVEYSSPTWFEEGDAWVYTCIKRNTYFFVTFSVGKWAQETCDRMIETLFQRTVLPFPDNKIEIFTDGNDDYTYILWKYYTETCLNYAQLVKIRENGVVIRKEKRTIYGNPDPEDISTTDVENFNGIIRERVGRLVRKTKCFSKLKRRLECAIELLLFYWDFINELKRGVSPAMMEGLTDHLWTWRDFLTYHFAV
jgi:IS1 family transposase